MCHQAGQDHSGIDHALWNGSIASHQGVIACVDTGCTNSLIGEATLELLRCHLQTKGLAIIVRTGECSFRFGADYTYTAKVIAVIPCSLEKKCFSIAAYVVPGATPLLLSLPLLRAWQAVLDLSRSKMCVDIWNIPVPLEESSRGHLHVDLWENVSGHRFGKEMTGCHLSPECYMYSQGEKGSRHSSLSGSSPSSPLHGQKSRKHERRSEDSKSRSPMETDMKEPERLGTQADAREALKAMTVPENPDIAVCLQSVTLQLEKERVKRDGATTKMEAPELVTRTVKHLVSVATEDASKMPPPWNTAVLRKQRCR